MMFLFMLVILRLFRRKSFGSDSPLKSNDFVFNTVDGSKIQNNHL